MMNSGHCTPGPYRIRIRALGITALFGVLAVMNLAGGGMGVMDRSLQEGAGSSRKLLKTYFIHETWDRFWESIYSSVTIYKDMGPPPVPADPSVFAKNIGYVLTLFHCPGDAYKQGFDTQFDPEHAFYDAAALLKYSIEKNTYPAGSKYNATMYAIVHPTAVRCTGRNGIEYDRVKVLHELDYRVAIAGDPIRHTDIGDSYVQDNIDGDAGIRDFMRLRSYNFDKHPVVVLVDFRTFVVQPSDILFDLFIASDKVVSFPMDYPRSPPSNGQNLGASMNFVAIKPVFTMMEDILDSYTTTIYNPTWGWDYKSVKDFDGILGLSGYFHHYFTRVKQNSIFSMLDRCEYANEAEDPMFVNGDGIEACRDPAFCTDCRTVGIDKIIVVKMGQICGAPWECHYDDNWPALTKSACETFHRFWYMDRDEYEKKVWIDGPSPERTGTYHPDVFMGYCNCEGPSCYEVMINDKP